MRFDRSVAWISRATPAIRPIGATTIPDDEPTDAEAREEEDAERDEGVVAQLVEGALVDELLEALELGRARVCSCSAMPWGVTTGRSITKLCDTGSRSSSRASPT